MTPKKLEILESQVIFWKRSQNYIFLTSSPAADVGRIRKVPLCSITTYAKVSEPRLVA
jgi:hypothetical protein